jgi:hypothetical protein
MYTCPGHHGSKPSVSAWLNAPIVGTYCSYDFGLDVRDTQDLARNEQRLVPFDKCAHTTEARAYFDSNVEND